MQKLLFSLLFSCLLSISLFGQWERMAQQKEFLQGNDNSFISQLAYYKDTILTLNDKRQIYFLTSKDTIWRKIKMPPIIDFSDRANDRNKIFMNHWGIFYVGNNGITTNPNNGDGKIFIYRTKDLGQTWDKTIITTPLYNGNLLSVNSQILGFENNLFILNFYWNTLGFLNSYKFNGTSWELLDNFASINSFSNNKYQVSKNRITYIRPEISKEIFIKDIATNQIKFQFLPTTLDAQLNETITCTSQDSTIVYVGRRANNFLETYIYVSKNLGKDWTRYTSSEYFSILSEIQITTNNLYINSTPNNFFVSSNNGINWQTVMLDNILRNNFEPLWNNFKHNLLATDSILLIFSGKNLFTKKETDFSWKFRNNLYTPFTNLSKVANNKLWATSPNGTFESTDNGSNWNFLTSEQPISSAFISKNGTFYREIQGTMYKSSDLGKSWIKELVFPNTLPRIVKNDTVFVPLSRIVNNTYIYKMFYSAYPYTKWDSLNIGDYPELGGQFSENIIYNLCNRKGIQRFKLDGTQLPTLLDDNKYYTNLIIDKNKIWVCNPFDTILKFSENYGSTWTNYPLLDEGFSIVKISNFLITNKRQKINTYYSGKINNTTGGIYLSADNGKSWFLFSDGIILNNEPFAPTFTQIDSFIFASQSGGLWRTNINNLSFKSLSGIVFLDKNKNGIKDNGEKGIPNANVFLSNAGAFTTTDSLGNYSFIADLKIQDTLKAKIENNYAQYTPQYLLVNQSDTIKNLGVYIPNNVIDLSISATSVTSPRSGFNNNYRLTYKNIGTAVVSGKVNFSYNTKQTLVEATPTVTSNMNNVLSWNYTNLQPNESRVINITLKTAIDMPLRSQITNVATIDPITTDTFKTNNIDSVYQTVVGSYDPNDKQITFLNTRQAPSVIDQNSDLTYTIRFQNTGNYQADFVRVTDTLNDKLDITTMKVLASSHNYVLSVKNKNVLVFEFNPIYLPDSTTDEKGSHGFIKFSIKPKRALTKDEVIKNTAQIFFDYNPAIITNTVETANQKVSGLFTPSVFESLMVYPNPSNGEISFNLDKHQGKEMNINVYSIDGKLMISKSAIGNTINTFDASYLKSGLYLLKIKVENETILGKFMIEK